MIAGGLRVFVDQDPVRDMVNIYVLSAQHVAHYKSGAHYPVEWVPQPAPGLERPEPFLSLPFDLWEALARSVGEAVDTTNATRDALTDARATRDRLLALVESSWKQWTAGVPS